MIEIIQIIALLRSDRILRKKLESQGDLLSLDLRFATPPPKKTKAKTRKTKQNKKSKTKQNKIPPPHRTQEYKVTAQDLHPPPLGTWTMLIILLSIKKNYNT